MGRTTVAVLVAAALAAAAGGIYVFVGGAPGGADAGNAEQVALGATVYGDTCASCHGVRLEGQPNWRQRLPDGTLPGPPHDAAGHTWHHPDRMLFDYTRRGGAAVAPPGFKSAMPGFGDSLSDREIWAVLAFIKSRWPTIIRDRQARLN